MEWELSCKEVKVKEKFHYKKRQENIGEIENFGLNPE